MAAIHFTDELEKKRVPEWRDYYVDYARLKGFIMEMQANGTKEAAQQFFDELTDCTDRVENFYKIQEEDLIQRVNQEIQAQTHGAKEEQIEHDLTKLETFAELNQQGLTKIAEKFDAIVGMTSMTRRGSGGAVPSAEQVSVRDKSNKQIEFGTTKESLVDRVTTKLVQYNFGIAMDRLENVRKQLKDSATTSISAESLLKRASTVSSGSLKQPLQKRKSMIAVQIEEHTDSSGDKIKRGFQKMCKSPGSIAYFVIMTAACVACFKQNLLKSQLSEYQVNGVALGDDNIWKGWFVIWTTTVALTLLIWQWPSDSVMMGATLWMNMFNIINTTEAWGAFANDVVLSVAALSVVGDCVAHTGFVDILFEKIIGNPQNLPTAMFKICIPCAIGAATISNTCVMACSMPAIEKWCSKSGYHIGLFYMPISYVMLIAGTFAVFSTSTNLITQALLQQHGLEPFKPFFNMGPAALCTVLALFYLVFVAPNLFMRRFMKGAGKQDVEQGGKQTDESSQRTGTRSFSVRLQITGKVEQTKTIEESSFYQSLLKTGRARRITAVERYGRVEENPPLNYKLQLNDIFSVLVSSDDIGIIYDLPSVRMLPLDGTAVPGTTHKETREIVVVVLDQASCLVSESLQAGKAKDGYGGSIVAFRITSRMVDERPEQKGLVRKGTAALGGQASQAKKRMSTFGGLGASLIPDEQSLPRMEAGANFEVRHGDQVILDVPAGFAQRFKESADFLSVRRVKSSSDAGEDEIDKCKAYTSGLILLVMLVFVSTSILPLFVCAVSAIFLLVITKCATVEGVKKSIPLKVVLTIVGAFGLGNAIGNHGIAALLANSVVSAFARFGPTGLLVAISAAVVMLGIVFHGTAVVALMFPLCKHVAEVSNIDMHQMMAVLCLSVACQMLSPVSYNTNLMAYAGCPEYEFMDFPKVGFPLVIITLAAGIPMCQYWFPGEMAAAAGTNVTSFM